MATCRHVVNTALRKLGRLAGGREARLSDATDTLATLQGLYGSWIAAGAFGRLADVVPAGSSYVSAGNERIYRREDTLSVTLPEFVAESEPGAYGRGARYYGTVITVEDTADGASVTVEPGQPIGATTLPRDGSVVAITDANTGAHRTWLYDGTAKRWDGLDGLTLDSEAPRSAADPDGLASALAIAISDQWGADVHPATMASARGFREAMTHRYGMRREAAVGEWF